MATSTHPSVEPDYAAIKGRQQKTWASGDYHIIAAIIQPVSERLADAVGLRAGERVLDVAAGSGNAAIAAARRLSTVTGVDYVPALLERGRTRAALAVRRRDGVLLGRPPSVAAGVRARIVAERAAGGTFRAIAGRLDRDGIPTARGGGALAHGNGAKSLATGARCCRSVTRSLTTA